MPAPWRERLRKPVRLVHVPYADEAQFFVDNYTSLTTPPPVYEVYNSSGTYSFVQGNAANADFANWGTYLVPTGRQGYLVFSSDPKDDATVDVINKTGVTIRVRFLRQ